MVYLGSLQYLYFDELYGESKNKICLSVTIDPYMFFLVSSRVPNLIAEQPWRMERQVLIDRANHNFILKQDSYLDCTELFGLIEDNIQQQMRPGGQEIKGYASSEVIKNVIVAVDGSPLLSERHQSMILTSMRDLLEGSQ